MNIIRILLVPMSDWICHPLASRLHFIFERLSKKHQIHVLWFKMNQLYEGKKRRTNIKLHNATFIPTSDLSTYYVLNAPYHYMKVKNILASEKIDIVITANIMAGTLACIAAKHKGIPTAFDYLDHYPDSAALHYGNAVVRTVVKTSVKTIVKENLKRANKVIVVSYSLMNLVKKEYGTKDNKLVFIPNGVDIQKFKQRSRDEALEKLGMERLKDYFLLVYVGSIDPRFDLETPIRAVTKLWHEGRKLKLLIIGPALSGYCKYLEDKYSNLLSVEFIGYVPNDLVPYYINSADICLAPYKMEKMNYGLTLKVLQYLASGKITFITPIPDVIKVFGDNVIVYHNENDLMEKIRKAIMSLDEHLLLAQKGCKIARQFSWSNITRLYEDFIDNLAGGLNSCTSFS